MNREEKIWMHFFVNAGIEHSVSREYTRIFIENRMKPTNLRDLTKDLLTDMGIHAVGDILSILNAAKKVSLVDDDKFTNKTIKLNSSNVEAMKIERQKVAANGQEAFLIKMVGEDGKRMSKAIHRTAKSKVVNTMKKSSIFDRLGDDFQIDCVEFSTSVHERFRNFACALYELNDLGDKNGGVVIGKYDYEENQLVEIDRCTGPGVYQLIWVGDDRILTANSDGSLRLAAQTRTDVWNWFSSVPVSNCTILSVLSRNETNFVASDAAGYVHIVSLDEADLQLEKSWLAHKHSGYFKSACEVWSLANDPNSYHVLYTGGEDGLLKLWDCRIQLLEAELVNSFHQAGVVCIRPNQQRSHILATSGYDDLLALWDIRNMQQCIDFIDLNSAAWTIRWDNENDQMRLLCACLSEGIAEIDVENESTLKLTRKDQCFGANLVYGCDWLCAKDNTIIFCTFKSKSIYLAKFKD
ncbi:Diphthamide biosynthesis protein 7 [Trichinella zimbabwensis]|uniref:methylated diphthine methylhydrolase n=1 Tax=Trichinella zimbabwensis TaxID=268475 RepID=A0A0V1HZ30_9BILA|nr:Diphthamide biosynthesis protein 7 [Trichinella zimbabwensis]